MTLRLKLTLGSIAVILVANAMLSLVLIAYLERVWSDEVQTRVRLDLNSARAGYQDQLHDLASYLRAAAQAPWLAAAVEQPEAAQRLDSLRRSAELDILCLLDSRGRVVYRAQNPKQRGDDLAADPVAAQALRQGRLSRGSVILPRERLLREGSELAERAQLALLPTPAARPTEDAVRTDGMAAAVAVPILDPTDHIVGLLYGANLLNRRSEIVDAIREQVFPADLYADMTDHKTIGTVTVFLGDLRIATNVLLDDGSRALGTRLSAEVYDRVLVHGDTWAAPALVVNDWYISAYEPIRDPDDRIIGALYVGLLQAPFAAKQRVILAVVVLMALVATLASLLLMYFVATLILRPVQKIAAMAQRVIAGDARARVGIRPPGEVGLLCQAIDQMADAVAEREERLKQATRQHIGRTEKLASIGRLAAGVAHEINNPLTGVLTFAHLMREKPNMDDQDREDLDLIVRETSRAAEIVRGLLDFARERPFNREPLDINEVIRRTVKLIRNQKLFDQIVIHELLQEDMPAVDGDMNQLQQVLLNLALNACEAMPNGGTITILSRACEDRVQVALSDTGCGIKREHADQIFEPFFTTKPVGKGTGLGLSVSYGIVRKHGGTLEVESAEGHGATFTVALPTSGNPGLAVRE